MITSSLIIHKYIYIPTYIHTYIHTYVCVCMYTEYFCFIAVVHSQVSLFAQSKFKLTYFLSQNVETFNSMFTKHDCGEPVSLIITMDELYKQLNHTVYSVSLIVLLV